MKIFNFIFSYYLLFLAFEPGIRALSFTEGQEISCCGDISCPPIQKEQPSKQSEKKGCDQTTNCNPFQICKTCTAFPCDFGLQTFSPIILFAKQQADSKEKIPAQISLDFWQPPKIA